MLAAEAEIRLLIAYGREFARPRPYRLAEACGRSISGVRTAYDQDEIAVVADRIGHPQARPTRRIRRERHPAAAGLPLHTPPDRPGHPRRRPEPEVTHAPDVVEARTAHLPDMGPLISKSIAFFWRVSKNCQLPQSITVDT
jgi:hypothetical protein